MSVTRRSFLSFLGLATVAPALATLLSKPSIAYKGQTSFDAGLFYCPYGPEPPLEKHIRSVLDQCVGEVNDAFTRSKVRHLISEFLRSERANGKVYQWTVVCDFTNNSPATIDSNSLIVDVYYQEARGTQPCNHIRASANRTGVSIG